MVFKVLGFICALTCFSLMAAEFRCLVQPGIKRCEQVTNFKQVVRINSPGHGCCTGFIVENGYIVSAGHCTHIDAAVTTVTFLDNETRSFQLIYLGDNQTDHDYSVFIGDTRNIDPLILSAVSAPKGSDCVLVGYAGSNTQFETQCTVGTTNPSYQGLVGLHAVIIPGDSGSPVFNNVGEVIGVATRSAMTEFTPRPEGDMVDIQKVRTTISTLIRTSK